MICEMLMWRAGANRKLGLDDKLFVLVDSVLVTGLGRIALMPCLVLAARICPEVGNTHPIAIYLSVHMSSRLPDMFSEFYPVQAVHRLRQFL